MSQHERTGWRDQWVSARHREWGYNVPAADVDCILTAGGEEMDAEGFRAAEYDNMEPVALIEYKARGATVRPTDANNTALRRLANRASLPFFVVVYDKHRLQFGVLPGNELARQLTKKTVLTEPAYVEFLHRIRGRTRICSSPSCAADS